MSYSFLKFNKKIAIITVSIFLGIFVLALLLFPLIFMIYFGEGTHPIFLSIEEFVTNFFVVIFPIINADHNVMRGLSVWSLLLLFIKMIFTYFVILSVAILFHSIKQNKISLKVIPAFIFIFLQMFGFFIMAQLLLVPGVCKVFGDMTTGSQWGNPCAFDVALRTEDVGWCNGGLRCVFELVKKTGDVSLCNEARDTRSCFNMGLSYFRDRSLCDESVDAEFSEICKRTYDGLYG